MKYLIILTALIIAIHCGCSNLMTSPLERSAYYIARQEFMDNYHITNVEREKAGLPPLDICTEKYYFDEDWANDDPNCKVRIEAYEAGDTSALGAQELSED